ncbi:MAG: tetratricopeptide repeat protein [Planctomycetota bacterium]
MATSLLLSVVLLTAPCPAEDAVRSAHDALVAAEANANLFLQLWMSTPTLAPTMQPAQDPPITTPSPGSSITRIAVDLDSADAIVVAQARAALELLDASSLTRLKEALEDQRPWMSAHSRAILFHKVNAILFGMLEELDTAVIDFSAARNRARPRPGVTPQQTAARKTARLRVNKIVSQLATSGLFLAPALARHVERNGSTLTLVQRVRQRLIDDLRQQVEVRWPQLPPAKNISHIDLRCLSALLPPPGENKNENKNENKKWDRIAERSANIAIEELKSFDQARISMARSWLLDLTETGQQKLDELARTTIPSPIPPGIWQEWRLRNRLRIPATVDLDSSISVGHWNQLSATQRRNQLIQLRAVHGEQIIPTLVFLARQDPDKTMRKRAAELLSLLGDPRGAGLLLAQRQFSSDPIEQSSRDAILRASSTLRDGGDLEGALALLDDLSQRLPDDAQIHHAIGVVTMRMRTLERAIEELQRSIGLDPTDPSTHYNLACAHALSGNAEKALESLQNAIQNGYTDAEHTRSDSDLESLRELPAFEALLDQMLSS